MKAEKAIEANDEIASGVEAMALKKRLHELGRVLGNKTLETGLLKGAVRTGRENTHAAAAVSRRRRFSVKRSRRLAVPN